MAEVVREGERVVTSSSKASNALSAALLLSESPLAAGGSGGSAMLLGSGVGPVGVRMGVPLRSKDDTRVQGRQC